MRHIFKGLAAILLPLSVVAADVDYSNVEARIRALAPQAQSIAISETPIEGLLMVQISGDIVYATDDGRYLIQGRVMDLDTREDLTETAKAALRKDLLANMDSSGSITFAPAEPRYELTVFTDIDCGYCRKLHNEIGAYNAKGITVRYLGFPRSGPDTPSYNKAVSVWCADDRNKAMTSAKSGAILPARDCANPIRDHLNAGVEMGVTGTPAIVMESGVLLPGYLPARKLADELDGKSGKRS